MDAARCPHCEFVYGWAGSYCTHCRLGSPDRDRWAGLRTLRDFPVGIGSERDYMLFAVGCLRSVSRLADRPVRKVINVIESWVEGKAAAPSVTDTHIAGLEINRYFGQTPPYGPPAKTEACRAILHVVRQLHIPDFSAVHIAFQAAAEVRAALAVDAIPTRDWWTFELPPELEQHRAAARHWYDLDDVERLNQGTSGASKAFSALGAAELESRSRQTALQVTEEATQCDLLRDVIPYPCEPVHWDASWLTSTVLALAAQIHASRDFTIMPILADALQDAACDSADVLDHCRANKPHIRGCWVVDNILGRR